MRDALDEGVTLKSLGAWRFQGIRDPESLYQVMAADLLPEFPALRAGTLIVEGA